MSHQERHVICEGYDDRAFWSGWLERRGCSVDKGAKDSRGTKVEGAGKYAFRSPSNALIVIHPADGKRRVRTLLERLFTGPHLDANVDLQLVVNVDADDRASERVDDYLQGLVSDFSPQPLSHRRWRCGDTAVDAVIWSVPPAAQSLGLGERHTLELVVATALAQVYPEATQQLTAWLAQAPLHLTEPTPNPQKRHVWSFFGKWFSHQGPDYFLRGLWENPEVASALEAILEPGNSILDDLVR